MIRIMLSNDRTEVDMDRLAQAFAISRDEPEDRIRVGTITYWFELGGGDYDTPGMAFRSADTGNGVTLDRVGNVISRTNEEARNPRSVTIRTESRASVTEDRRIRSAGYAAPNRSDAPAMDESDSGRRVRLEALLNAALQDTFPASDQIVLGFEAPNRPATTLREAP